LCPKEPVPPVRRIVCWSQRNFMVVSFDAPAVSRGAP
jgi:hypothetical protein